MNLKEVIVQKIQRENERNVKKMWENDNRGLTYEDYCIYVFRVGYQNYARYNQAHWRDVDVTTGMDVWKTLQNAEPKWVKAIAI